MRIETRILEGSDIAKSLVDLRTSTRSLRFFSPARRKLVDTLRLGRLLQKIVHLAKDMQIVIVSKENRLGRLEASLFSTGRLTNPS